jgi:sugar lactone lactonase YvrE
VAAAILLPILCSAQDKRSVITTIAGTGKKGFEGDGGLASNAFLDNPFHCDFDKAGNLYICDMGNDRIRKLTAKTGILTTVAGSGNGTLGAGDGGPALKAVIASPYAVAVDDSDNLFIVEQRRPVVRKVDGKTGIVTTLAGTGVKGFGGDGGRGEQAMLREPNDCCLDGKGGLLIADVQDWRVRRVDLETGIITTFAGIGRPKEMAKLPAKLERGNFGDGGQAKAAIIVGARAVCVDGKGNTFICEREGNAIRKVDAKGVITLVAGTGVAGYSGDGADAARATFRGPKGIRCDAEGNLFVVDTENHAIRRIDAKTNIVTTVAGGRKSGEGDGGNAIKAGLDRPHGCVVGPDGTLIIADSENHRVRAVKAFK